MAASLERARQVARSQEVCRGKLCPVVSQEALPARSPECLAALAFQGVMVRVVACPAAQCLAAFRSSEEPTMGVHPVAEGACLGTTATLDSPPRLFRRECPVFQQRVNTSVPAASAESRRLNPAAALALTAALFGLPKPPVPAKPRVLAAVVKSPTKSPKRHPAQLWSLWLSW